MNKVILLGNLGSDPEVKILESGIKKVRFTIATNESYVDRSGERKVQTDWHSVEVWDKQAETAERYLRKGRKVLVEGKLKTEKWKDNQGIEKSRQYIRCTSFELVDRPEQNHPESNPRNDQNNGQYERQPVTQETSSGSDNTSDDLPF